MARCVLVLGGVIENYDRIRLSLRDDDYFIYCDKGLMHEKGLERSCSLAVGDFDSLPVPDGVEYVRFPSAKDDTDALCGIKEGIKRGYGEFLILGALGKRIDHELANIYLLEYLDSLSLKGEILSDNARLMIVGREEVKIEKGARYFSLLALFGRAEGVYIKGAEYNLDNAVIESRHQYGVSNEVEKEEAYVRVENGRLLVVIVDEE